VSELDFQSSDSTLSFFTGIEYLSSELMLIFVVTKDERDFKLFSVLYSVALINICFEICTFNSMYVKQQSVNDAISCLLILLLICSVRLSVELCCVEPISFVFKLSLLC